MNGEERPPVLLWSCGESLTIEHMLLSKLQVIVQELCENQGGRPGLSVLTSLLVSVDVKLY